MADEVFRLLWDVRARGYQWIDATSAEFPDDGPQRFLVESEGDTTISRYSLEDHPALFRVFADTPPTEEGILEFARKYGRLGGDAEERIQAFFADREVSPIVMAERFGTWAGQIEVMRQQVQLWDMARASDTQGLSRFIEWEGRDAVFCHDGGSRDRTGSSQTIASWNVAPELLQQLRPGDLIQPTLVVVQRSVNTQLGGGRVSPRLLWDHTQTRASLHIVPNSLIGALWLQFARAIDGDRSYRRCTECQKWFEISPKTARTTRLYCSNACRSKAYRKRQNEATRLDGEGLSIDEIASRFQTNSKVVAGWIARAGTTVSQSARTKQVPKR